MKQRLDEIKFSPREKRVFSLFWKAGFNEDIAIDKMYAEYHGVKPTEFIKPFTNASRHRQMSIGMVVTRINRKLKGTKVVPGALKRTYRLINNP